MHARTTPHLALVILPLALPLLAISGPAAHAQVDPAAGPYGRLGGGIDWPESTGFADDNCASQQPAALFGCRAGNNGRPLGASGSFDPLDSG